MAVLLTPSMTGIGWSTGVLTGSKLASASAIFIAAKANWVCRAIRFGLNFESI